MKLKHLLLVILAVGSNAMLAAQDASDKPRKFEFRAEAATFNTLDWGLECGVSYFPIEYAGVGVSLCGAGDFTTTGELYSRDGLLYDTEDLHNGVWLRSGVQLRTPSLWKNADGSMRLLLQEECGVTLPVPTNQKIRYTTYPDKPGTYVGAMTQTTSNSGATAAFFHSKTSVVFGIDRWKISAGYTWSNMDVYSSTRDAARKMSIELPAKKNLSGVHVGVSYAF